VTGATPASVLRFRDRYRTASVTDLVATEEPLEVRIGGRPIAVLMRTPGHDRELAAGFLRTEGVLREPDDLLDVLTCRELSGGGSGNVVDALLAPGVAVDWEGLTRHVFGASSCGVCGKTTIDAVLRACEPVRSPVRFAPSVLAALPERLAAAQPCFEATGGLHGAALATPEGELALVREDVGRHNAVDKLVGRSFLDARLPLDAHALVVSGRVSFELVQKALAAGIPVLAGIGAPSSLAIECAVSGRMTLVGFLRRDRWNVYTGAERIAR